MNQFSEDETKFHILKRHTVREDISFVLEPRLRFRQELTGPYFLNLKVSDTNYSNQSNLQTRSLLPVRYWHTSGLNFIQSQLVKVMGCFTLSKKKSIRNDDQVAEFLIHTRTFHYLFLLATTFVPKIRSKSKH